MTIEVIDDRTGEAIRTGEAARLLLERRRCRMDLAAYLRRVYEMVDRKHALRWNWHLDAIAEHLMAMHRGELQRLVINVPPRFLKSITCSVAFPSWLLGQDPGEQILVATYGYTLAKDLNVACRDVMLTRWYRTLFPDTRLAKQQAEELTTTSRGHRLSTTVGASPVGRGFNYGIVDDPLNPKQAASDAERKTANDWMDGSWSSRRNDPDTARELVIMQRLHHQDVTGHLLEQGGWEQLSLPMVAEDREVISIGSYRHVREAGELLHPERISNEEVERRKTRMGSYHWSAQDQQRPTPIEGGLAHKDWWRWYDTPPDFYDQVIQSWDMAFKDTKDSAFVAGHVWGRRGAHYYLIDRVHRKLDFMGTIRAVRDLSARNPSAFGKVIEDKANGPAIVSALRHQVEGLLPWDPAGSKEARAMSVAPLIEAGNVWLPNEPWAYEVVQEWAEAPYGDYWDDIDASSQALLYLSRHGFDSDDVVLGGTVESLEGVSEDWSPEDVAGGFL